MRWTTPAGLQRKQIAPTNCCYTPYRGSSPPGPVQHGNSNVDSAMRSVACRLCDPCELMYIEWLLKLIFASIGVSEQKPFFCLWPITYRNITQNLHNSIMLVLIFSNTQFHSFWCCYSVAGCCAGGSSSDTLPTYTSFSSTFSIKTISCIPRSYPASSNLVSRNHGRRSKELSSV